MPTYLYRAIDLASEAQVEGALEATSDREARSALRARGVLPIAIALSEDEEAPLNPRLQWLIETLTFRPVKPKEMTLFTQQLAALVEAGLPIVDGMLLLEEQTTNPSLKTAVTTIRKDLLSGVMLSDAVAKHHRLFSPLYVHMIAAGEHSGALDVMLGRLADMLDKNLEVERKVKAALTYPALLSITLVGVIAIILVFVVPAFKNIYGRAGQALPLPTQVLIAISETVRGSALPMTVLGVLAFLVYRWFRQTEVGRPLVDRAWLHLPLIGPLLIETSANTFTRAFGTVYGAGVPIVSALENCRRVITNAMIAQALAQTEEGIRQGRPLSEGLQNTRYFPKIMAQIITIGEATGKLEELTRKAVTFSEKELDHKIKQMTSMLEPLMTIVMGFIVMGIALALYLPMFDLPKILSRG